MSVSSTKPARLVLATALLAVAFFALPIRADVQHPFGFALAHAGRRHDSANPNNNNTDNYGHEHNEYLNKNNGS